VIEKGDDKVELNSKLPERKAARAQRVPPGHSSENRLIRIGHRVARRGDALHRFVPCQGCITKMTRR
jgi:hypothetical protein